MHWGCHVIVEGNLWGCTGGALGVFSDRGHDPLGVHWRCTGGVMWSWREFTGGALEVTSGCTVVVDMIHWG